MFSHQGAERAISSPLLKNIKRKLIIPLLLERNPHTMRFSYKLTVLLGKTNIGVPRGTFLCCHKPFKIHKNSNNPLNGLLLFCKF